MAAEEIEEPRVGTVLLGLGSNLGDRVRHLERAIERLGKEIRLEAISSIYETQPLGDRDQPWYLNLVCLGVTRFGPRGVLEFIAQIEADLGRDRGEGGTAPRTIDIDILAYDDRIIDEPDLQLPHPRMGERAFVLEPLCEIAPDWRHPVLSQSAREMLDRTGGGEVRLFSDPPPASVPRPFL